MKVIHQLIDYFQARGALTDGQIEYLRRQGFWPEEDEADGKDEAPAGDEEIAAAEWPWEDPLRRPRRCAGTGAMPDARELCRRLNGVTAYWNEPLQGFIRLAQRLRPCASWEQAVVALRAADARPLQAALQAALAAGTLDLGTLDRALDLQDYRWEVVGPRARGPAAKAYRALLAARDWNDFGARAWLLRHQPVRQIFNLVQAKRAVVDALAGLYREDPERLAAHLRGHSRRSLFWAFVILYNAEGDAAALRREASRYWSRYPGPHIGCYHCERAGLYALRMRPERVLPFLTQPEWLELLDEENPEWPPRIRSATWTVPATWTFVWEKYVC